MTYDLKVTNRFKKDAKKYKKKYKNIGNDLDEVIQEIRNGELKGSVIPNIKMTDNENNVIKVRVANSDIPCGERGRLQTDLLCRKKQWYNIFINSIL